MLEHTFYKLPKEGNIFFILTGYFIIKMFC